MVKFSHLKKDIVLYHFINLNKKYLFHVLNDLTVLLHTFMAEYDIMIDE